MIRPQLCPVCSKAFSIEAGALAATLPFCSERCRQVDLLRWCRGEYVIVDPAEPSECVDDPADLEE